MEIENKTMVTRSWGKQRVGIQAVSAWDDKKVLEMDSGNSYTEK